MRPEITLRSGARLPPFPTGELGRPASGASALSSRAEVIQSYTYCLPLSRLRSDAVISRASDKHPVVARPGPGGEKRRGGWTSHHEECETLGSFLLRCAATGSDKLSDPTDNGGGIANPRCNRYSQHRCGPPGGASSAVALPQEAHGLPMRDIVNPMLSQPGA